MLYFIKNFGIFYSSDGKLLYRVDKIGEEGATTIDDKKTYYFKHLKKSNYYQFKKEDPLTNILLQRIINAFHFTKTDTEEKILEKKEKIKNFNKFYCGSEDEDDDDHRR